MFKIEIKDGNKLIKKKIYESKSQYEKWIKEHTKNYESCYSITGFQQINGVWQKQ